MFRESRYRLAWSVSVLLLLGFLASSISSYYVSRNNVRQTITESSLPLTSDNIYSVIQRDLLQPIFISSMMANDAFLREWTLGGEKNPEQMQRYLDEIRREYDTVTSFFVSETTRNYYYWDGILKQVAEDEPRDIWYFRVREMQAPFEINVDYDMANRDTMTIFVNYRVFDFEGNFIGAAGTGLTVNRVNELIEEYERRFGREIFFVDREGTIVVSPEKSGLSQLGHIQNVPGLAAHAEFLLGENTATLQYERDGEIYFLNSRFVPELDWYLMVDQTENQLLASLRETLLLNIALAIVLTAVVAFVCIVTINRHHRKLESRNDELSRMNVEIQRQKVALEQSSRSLESANSSLAALNREKDDFLGIVAHDLRNPLSGVIGLTEEIRLHLPATDEQLHEYLSDIRTSGYEMLELISDILTVSSIENFQGPINLEDCNWNRLASDARDRFTAQAAGKKIHLEMRLLAPPETSVPTRETWLTICLNNLVSNAIKYAPHGTRVIIETTSSADGSSFELRVRDQGPGIPPHELEHIFEKFRRSSSIPTGGESSSGLGLYIVRKMCQRLGATVSVDSELGVGSCFIIRHPLHKNQTI